MIDEFQNDNLFLSSFNPSTTNSDFNSAIPEDGRTVVVFDENVFGLAAAQGITDVFFGLTIAKVELVAFAGATDTQISDVISHKNWKTIFVTADTGKDILIPSNHIAVVRFTNNNTSTDTQLSLLWRLTQTKGFRAFENWFDKDIRLSAKNVYYISDRNFGEKRKLHLPHQNSSEYKHWIMINPTKKSSSEA
ncbi:MAG: hypothetical protein PHI73_02720 [Patescibacteria group bacterium]|nr:hypothetical protein [Patescibacteria group bacterium]